MSAYPIPSTGFLFNVNFGFSEMDTRFQEVSGLTVSLEVEEFKEAGENRFVHRLPVRTKYENLILKRGLLTDSKIIDWCKKAVDDFEFELRDITIQLLNSEKQIVAVWNVTNAYPLKWSISGINAMQSEFVIETLELAYHYFKFEKGSKQTDLLATAKKAAEILL
ncbi:MAG: phage tail protein [Chitinophagales bacterium]